jgi:hypothetical protein
MPRTGASAGHGHGARSWLCPRSQSAVENPASRGRRLTGNPSREQLKSSRARKRAAWTSPLPADSRHPGPPGMLRRVSERFASSGSNRGGRPPRDRIVHRQRTSRLVLSQDRDERYQPVHLLRAGAAKPGRRAPHGWSGTAPRELQVRISAAGELWCRAEVQGSQFFRQRPRR